MQIFKDNPFPILMFRGTEQREIHDKNGREEALADGWTESYIPLEYPKMLYRGEPVEREIHGVDGTHIFRERMVVNNAIEEDAAANDGWPTAVKLKKPKAA